MPRLGAARPSRHVPGWADLTSVEAAVIGVALSRLTKAREAVQSAACLNLPVIVRGSPHLHIHRLPRHPWTLKGAAWTLVEAWPRARQGSRTRPLMARSWQDRFDTALRQNSARDRLTDL